MNKSSVPVEFNRVAARDATIGLMTAGRQSEVWRAECLKAESLVGASGEYCTSDERSAYNLDRFGRSPEQIAVDRGQCATQGEVFPPGSLEMAHYLLKSQGEGISLLAARLETLEACTDHAKVPHVFQEREDQIRAELHAVNQENARMSDTISDLRKQLAAKSALVHDMETVEHMQLKSARVKVKQLEAIIAEKNREIKIAWEESKKNLEMFNAFSTECEQHVTDAKLGALVRQMPFGGAIFRYDQEAWGNNLFYPENGTHKTPEEALIRQAKEK